MTRKGNARGFHAMREARAEPVTPAPDRFVTDDHPALEQQFFDITRAELKPEIPAHRATDDRRREAVTMVKRFCILHHAILLDHLSNVTVPCCRASIAAMRHRKAGASSPVGPNRRFATRNVCGRSSTRWLRSPASIRYPPHGSRWRGRWGGPPSHRPSSEDAMRRSCRTISTRRTRPERRSARTTGQGQRPSSALPVLAPGADRERPPRQCRPVTAETASESVIYFKA